MNRYSAVHQFHSGSSLGDAITQQMLHVQEHLLAMGHKSEIFAEHIDPRLRHRIHLIDSYEGSGANLLLMHHSMGNDAFDNVMSLPDDIVAVYHNITPERFFKGDPGVRKYIQLGRDQLAALARRARCGVADSNYNRKEMLAVGFKRVEVLPVRTDFTAFTAAGKAGRVRSSDWLFVGRIVPNKCQHDLVRAFAVYHRSFDGDARLVLVGDTSHQDYVEFVRSEAARFDLADRVVILGKIEDSRLRSAYASAGVFVSLSEHEGFGVPILEAMAAGVPVVAFGAAAVPETMGGAGVLLRTKEPAVVASVVQSLGADPDLHQRLVERQQRRVAGVQAFEPRTLLERVINRASGAHLPLEIQVQGPFETSYSLAVVNRKLATGLDGIPGRSLSIFATEGPGNYQPRQTDLDRFAHAATLFRRASKVRYPDVVIRQMWPPRVIDSPGGLTCEYFGWEESLVPAAIVDDFNRYVDGIGVMSRFVEQALRDSGVDVPIRVVGVGVETPDPTATVDAPELGRLRTFRFLHISSAFPRKGVDVLLKAYFAGFDGSNDVSLILKTFPNPHNEVGKLLKDLRAQHPNPPDVRWIDRDLEDWEVEGLYNLANCYVHPARGEGFGLPVAEAMAAGIPVISVVYSGLADFVSPETAVTIPFAIEPSRSHFDLAGATWAEPDQARLAIEMDRLVNDPDADDVRRRVETARQLIETRFSWAKVLERWISFLDELEEAAETVRVAMVSTWNSRCGVAEYSRYLVEQMADSVAVEIFANKGVEIIDPAYESSVTRSWINRWSPDLDGLEDDLNLSDADVVHIQFNFGFFELGRMAQLIDSQLERRSVVITFHRTADIDIDGELVSLSQIRSSLQRVDRVIVHQEADARFLAGIGVADNVQLVYQGVASGPSVTPLQVREAAKLGNRPVIGAFGFLLPHKGMVELLAAVASLRSEFPDICLLALCARHPDASLEYETAVRAEIERSGLQDNVVLITDYLPDQTVRAILCAADAIVLPYLRTEESSSAALRFVLPLGRPIIATDIPIFADVRQALLLIERADPSLIEDAVRRVLTDPELERDLAKRVSAAARRFRWSLVAANHREIYSKARHDSRSRQLGVGHVGG